MSARVFAGWKERGCWEAAEVAEFGFWRGRFVLMPGWLIRRGERGCCVGRGSCRLRVAGCRFGRGRRSLRSFGKASALCCICGGEVAEEATVGFEAENVVGFIQDGFAFALFEVAVGLEGRELLGGFFGADVAVLLDEKDDAADAGEGVGDADVFVGVGSSCLRGFAKVTEEFADSGGGELKAGFGEFDWLGAGEYVGEGFLAGAHFLLPELVIEPVLVSAFFPFVDVAGRESFAGIAKLLDDFNVGEAVLEPLIDVVAEVFGEGGDLAGATVVGVGIARSGVRIFWVRWRGRCVVGADCWRIWGLREVIHGRN
jgi:hypothetical protein